MRLEKKFFFCFKLDQFFVQIRSIFADTFLVTKFIIQTTDFDTLKNSKFYDDDSSLMSTTNDAVNQTVTINMTYIHLIENVKSYNYMTHIWPI